MTIKETTNPATLIEYLSHRTPLRYAPTRLPSPKKKRATATSKSLEKDD